MNGYLLKRECDNTEEGMKVIGGIEIEEGFDYDNEVCVGIALTSEHVYLDKEELRQLRDHINILLEEDK